MFSPQEQYDRLLVMYPSNLIILSEESDGLFYKVQQALCCYTLFLVQKAFDRTKTTLWAL